jgi:hypothetical protein
VALIPARLANESSRGSVVVLLTRVGTPSAYDLYAHQIPRDFHVPGVMRPSSVLLKQSLSPLEPSQQARAEASAPPSSMY